MKADIERPYLSLAVFLAICAMVSIVGGLVTATSVGGWYQTLDKPPFNPPDWVFGPVWTLLFVMIAVAGWRVWQKRHARAVGWALTVYALQLLLNLGWSVLFFGMQRVDLAAIEIVIFLAAIALNVRLFMPIDRLAGLLLVPYLCWVGFATVLTVAIFRINS